MNFDEDRRTQIAPGQTIGIYGGGQLGRMLAMVARQWGYRVHVFTSEADAPASHFANRVFVGADDDEKQFREFSRSIDVLTFEFESVSVQSLEWLPQTVPVRPSAGVFWTAQDRLREKQFLKAHSLPLPDFAAVQSLQDLENGLAMVGTPAVLKTTSGGYDGKGQCFIQDEAAAAPAWQAVKARPSTVESFVDLQCEVSVIVARDAFGNVGTYGPIENRHINHILDLSFAPSSVAPEIAARACAAARQIADSFQLCGLICVEFFVTRDGTVLVNEIAPRPHNSGHLTIEAFATSQFEQQLRCVCGLKLGSTAQIRPAAMVNLFGDRWIPRHPDFKKVTDFSETYLHLYDKRLPLPGRKMGHITACADDVQKAIDRAVGCRDAL